jgi:hypothetical protein
MHEENEDSKDGKGNVLAADKRKKNQAGEVSIASRVRHLKETRDR